MREARSEDRARAQRNGESARNRIEAIMTEHFFDHDSDADDGLADRQR